MGGVVGGGGSSNPAESVHTIVWLTVWLFFLLLYSLFPTRAVISPLLLLLLLLDYQLSLFSLCSERPPPPAATYAHALYTCRQGPHVTLNGSTSILSLGLLARSRYLRRHGPLTKHTSNAPHEKKKVSLDWTRLVFFFFCIIR